MELPGRNYYRMAVLMFFLVFLISGCAKQPVRFSEPGTQIWNLNFIVDIGDDRFEIENQKMFLIPSPTEKGVFSVVAEISSEIDPPAGTWSAFLTTGEWKGEIRNGVFTGTTNRIEQTREHAFQLQGSVKGIFSGSRASGTFRESGLTEVYGKWTAEKIS